MNTQAMRRALIGFACCLLLPLSAYGSSTITGSTSLSYDAFSHTVTAVTSTQLDYAAQDWYAARVSGNIKDASGNVLASGSRSDYNGAGEATVTLQAYAPVDATYTASSHHSASPFIRDYNIGGAYIDYWAFQYVQSGVESRSYTWVYMPFYGFGPRRTTRLSSLYLGPTSISILALPQTRIESVTPDPPSIKKGGGETTVKAVIFASSELQEGDKVKFEVGKTTPGGDFNYPATVEVDITPTDSVTAEFKVGTKPTNSLTGDVSFRVRIIDVLRPNNPGNPAQGYYSLLNVNPPRVQALPADGTTWKVVVNP